MGSIYTMSCAHCHPHRMMGTFTLITRTGTRGGACGAPFGAPFYRAPFTVLILYETVDTLSDARSAQAS